MIQRLLPFLSLIILFVALSIASPHFLTETNLSSVVRQTAVINIMSLVAMVGGVLLHSGKGGGLSDMFGGGGGAALGSTAAERNLNRITFVFALIWVITVIALGLLLT